MKLTREQVLHVAALAHLELSEAEVEGMGRQLSDILTYIDKLNELDTSRVEPMAQIQAAGFGEDASLREDVEQPCGIAPEVLQVAPDPSPPYFRVPKVIERSE
jgi:aspartyl-tRNA(Asn)/glutamyl-tRNA(Gln) amidotransferase subunit C